MKARLIIYYFLIGLTCCSLSVFPQDTDIDYLGRTPPGDTPEIFAPGTVSVTGRAEERPFFLNEGKWFIYQTNNFNYNDERKHILTRNNDGSWSDMMDVTDTVISEGSNIGVTYADQYITVGGITDSSFTIYLTQLTDEIWQQTDTITLNMNIPFWCGIPNLTKSRNIYFSVSKDDIGQNMDLYKSEFVNDEYQDPVVVLTNAQLSYVSPDEDYIICEKLVGGIPDLKIAFSKEDGTWTSPVDLGEKINTNCAETMPVMSPDGKYLFFTRWNTYVNCLSDDAELMWVEIESKIEALRSPASSVTDMFTDHENIVYPNPANHTLYINVNELPVENINYCLINSSGNIVMKGKPDHNSINISELENGIYVLQLLSDTQIISRLVIVE